jgi:hypothetical protein
LVQKLATPLKLLAAHDRKPPCKGPEVTVQAGAGFVFGAFLSNTENHSVFLQAQLT